MKKYFNIAILLVFLVGLPLGSFLYLKGGLDYRKQAVKELENKTPVGLDKEWAMDQIILSDATTVVHLGSDDSQTLSLFSQFRKAPSFQIVDSKPLIDTVNYLVASSSTLDALSQKYPKASYLLIDAESNVRSSYTYSEADLQNLVKHVATILPVVKKRKETND